MFVEFQEPDKESINQLRLYRYEGPVIIVDSITQFNKEIKVIAKEDILGLDTERRPSFKKGVIHPISLLQIATRNCVYLLRIKDINIPRSLTAVLENKNQLKVGIGLDDDLSGLQKIKPFNPAGFLDLSHFFQSEGYTHSSVKFLAAMILNVRISKKQQVSNWERDELTDPQVKYAATDAWLPREIYMALKEEGIHPKQ